MESLDVFLTRIGTMNLEMRKCLKINGGISRFMERELPSLLHMKQPAPPGEGTGPTGIIDLPQND